MRRLLICILLFSMSGTTACQPRLMWWKQEPDSYQAIVRKWTRTGEYYKGLNTILVVSATFPHEGIRRAHVHQYALDHHLSEQEEKELLFQEEEKAKNKLEFIVTTFSDEEEWCQLGGDGTIWTLYLSNGKGVRVKAQKVECFKEVPIYIKTYYSVVSPWKQVYRVTFPYKVQNAPIIDENTHHFDMEFVSAVGHIKLHWDVKEDLTKATE